MSPASLSVIDPVELARDLIRIPSVTPADEGAMDVLERALTRLGFTCRRMVFQGPSGEGHDAPIENLYARLGTASPNLCFAGHTDVVPTGDLLAWDQALATSRLLSQASRDEMFAAHRNDYAYGVQTGERFA